MNQSADASRAGRTASLVGLVLLGLLALLLLYFDGVVLVYGAFWTSKDIGLMVIAVLYVALAAVTPIAMWVGIRSHKGWRHALLLAIGLSLLFSVSALPLVLWSIAM